MDLRTELAKRVVQVTFKKVNGDTRVMDCTTNLESVPPSAWPKGKVSEAKDRNLHVYDVKKQGWRSIIPENVIEFK